MTKKRLMVTLATVLSLSLFGGLIGCGSRQPAEPAATQTGTAVETQAEEQGGVISLKVNPEIAVFYDENGAVTKIESRNDDGKKVITDYTGFEGKECRVVIGELIALIKETSIVSMISIIDLTNAAKLIGSGNNMATYLVPMLVAALFYLAIVYILTFFLRRIEKKLRESEQHISDKKIAKVKAKTERKLARINSAYEKAVSKRKRFAFGKVRFDVLLI